MEDNRYRVEISVAAQEEVAKDRKAKLQQELNDHIAEKRREGNMPNENYVWMTKGCIDAQDIKLQSMIPKLQEKKELLFENHLVAVAHLKVAGE